MVSYKKDVFINLVEARADRKCWYILDYLWSETYTFTYFCLFLLVLTYFG